jgi:ABC-2 type transport system permease protein
VSARREIWEVARREFVERWRSRAMRVSFAILLAFVVGGAVLLTLADEGTPADDFGLVGPRAVALAPALRVGEQADGRRAQLHRLRDRAAAERALREGEVDVAIVDGRLIVEEDRSSPAVGVAQRAIAVQHTVTRLQAAGLTQQQALDTLEPPRPRVEVLDLGARDRQREEDVLFVGMVALFMALIVYGQSVASSVAEEKSSRVIELLLTTLPPRRLLAGKVLGVGTLGVSQLAAVCVAGLLSAQIAGGEGLPPSAPRTVALVIGWFILGFAFYSVVYAALGALVSRQEDLEATTAPVNVLLIGAYFGAMAAIASPDGAWAQIAAFLPPLAPLIVPTRVVLGDMSAIGLVAAVTISVLATLLLIRVAAGIYERSVLRTGAPIGLRAALAGPVGGASRKRARGHLPPAVLQAGAVTGLVGGILVGTDKPLGIVLVAIGLVLVILHQRRRHHPPRSQA